MIERFFGSGDKSRIEPDIHRESRVEYSQQKTNNKPAFRFPLISDEEKNQMINDPEYSTYFGEMKLTDDGEQDLNITPAPSK